MCRGFCKETQKATPNYSTVVLGVMHSKKEIMSKLSFSVFLFVVVSIQAGYLHADQCDFARVQERENTLLSSYVSSENQKKSRSSEQIEIQVFGKPIVLPNRYKVRVNQGNLHLSGASTFIQYLGCKRNPFATGHIAYGPKKNCMFCRGESEGSIVVTDRIVNPKLNLNLKVVTQNNQEGAIYSFFNAENFLVINDPNPQLGEFVFKQLSASR